MLGDEIRLVMRLMGDRRVPMLLKLIPIGTLVYFIIPIDLLVGPIDDAVVIGLGLYLFIELCPPDVVAEHRQAIRNTVDADRTIHHSDDRPSEPSLLDEDQIIDGEFRED
jgi:uncharacterized membrane protein YkvA (DUF1232 family)